MQIGSLDIYCLNASDATDSFKEFPLVNIKSLNLKSVSSSSRNRTVDAVITSRFDDRVINFS